MSQLHTKPYINPHAQLILGGARSGKSRLAEQRARASGKRLIYLATATAGDGQMAQRIATHQQRRDEQWQLVEEPLQLAQTLGRYNSSEYCILVDCLTLWLSNCLHHNCWPQQREALLQTLPELHCQLILVSNEVGSGIVPLGELSRQFADQSGFLHQALAGLCHRVTLTVAGLPLELKTAQPSPPSQPSGAAQ